MLKALALGLQFAAALASLAFSIGIIIIGMLNRRLTQKRQPKPELQEPARLIPRQHPIPQAVQIAPRPRSPTEPPPTRNADTPTMILNACDHRIYITSGSRLMIPHPKADSLLRELDKILYVAAHRNGDPFTLPVELDTSASSSISLPSVQDDEFLPTSPVSLPSPDGHLWYTASGKEPRRLGTTS
ncbi:hypothetical protein QE369_000751 [Agrobacterium larrymoorei]|uniref:Uncharacterized protein n=1 Tax=Agrobacterium larrymoorei TaxID=160699 RepID=A0AAJ2B573_9HYPH|nr:hypothetical protein [Agrobacterium larrymoorei]MDR6100573.1 hypothetical protein [Agrobacterium larrymoorei]